MMMTVLGPRVIAPAAAFDAVNGIFAHWGEDEAPDADESYRRIVSWLGGEAPRLKGAGRVARRRTGQASRVARWIGRHGLPIGNSPAAALPKGARYLNVSQFPLWIPDYFRWLKRRPDLKGVFFIHDLLPIETPEYFREGEYGRHLRRLSNLADFGAAAIVTTQVVKEALRHHLAQLGRTNMPILVAPIPAAPIFSEGVATPPELGPPYFVACGTIEPRKNHLLLLHVWRELVRREGPAAPKLVLIGARGWENENVVDLLERCRTIGDHVIEASGVSTPSLKALLDGARALLMPSFAEGYGLPIGEALAAGTPVIASDIPAFRECAGGRILRISPIDGEKWLETVHAFAIPNSPVRKAVIAHQGLHQPSSLNNYFARIEAFLASL
jgi:glycosyltransferase involved in cell wall biosynthesis